MYVYLSPTLYGLSYGWVLGIALLFGGATSAVAEPESESETALMSHMVSPTFCDVAPASNVHVLETATALYRGGQFRAAAAQLATLALTIEPGPERLRALALWERSLKVMACDDQAFSVQRAYQQQAELQGNAAVERCHALGRLARLTVTRNVNDAERLARQTITCAVATSSARDVASEAHTTLAIIALGRSDTAAAEEQLRSALPLAASPLMHSEALRTQGVLLLQRSEDPAEAEHAFEMSLNAARQAHDPEAEAIAAIYLGDGRLRKAAPDVVESADLDAGIRIANAGEMRRIVALARHRQGLRLFHSQTGVAMAQAVSKLKDSATLYAIIGDRSQESSAQIDLGSALLQIGDYPRARAAVERSRNLSIESGREREAAKADHSLGLIARLTQPADHAMARQYLEKALSALRSSGDNVADIARVLNDLGGVQLAAGGTEEATAQLLEAAQLAQRQRNLPLQASINASLGWVYWYAGFATEAHAAWRAALQNDQPAARAAAWWGLAQMVQASSPNAALSRYARAADEVERLRPRAGIVDDETRTAFGRRYSELYREYAALLLRLGYAAQAHYVMLMTLQQELIEARWGGTRSSDGFPATLPGRPDSSGDATCDVTLTSREKNVLQLMHQVQRDYTRAYASCCLTPNSNVACAANSRLTAYCSLDQELKTNQKELLLLQNDCVKSIETSAQQRTQNTISDTIFALPEHFRDGWSKASADGVHLIVTIVEDERLHVLLRMAGTEGYMTRTTEVSRKKLSDMATEVAIAMTKAVEAKNSQEPSRSATLAQDAKELQNGTLRKLYELIFGQFDIAALAKDNGTGRAPKIAFVLDRVLREVPMAALYDGKRYLGERFAISMVTRTTIYSQDMPPASKSLVMGVSTNLKYVAGEISEVARILKATPYLNQTSTRANLRAWLESLSTDAPGLTMHLASHAAIGNTMGISSVKLWGSDELTGSDLNDLKPSLRNIRLVVLSACRSAGQGSTSDLALGLAGLAEKGSRSVIGTLWDVDDASTSQLMSAFYEAWQRDPKAGIAQAMALAQRKMLRELPHPYFWAPAIVIGRWD